MSHFKAIALDNGTIQIHPYRKSDSERSKEIERDLYEIYGDFESLEYSPERFINDKEIIFRYLLGVAWGYEHQIKYTHFITLKKINKLIGEIMIISPKHVKKSYNIDETWLIEFYLNKHLRNKGIMTGVVNAVVREMEGQGIKKIGALVIRENISSIRVLEKSNFKKLHNYDAKQDYYEKSSF